jgi:hypothetical protein
MTLYEVAVLTVAQLSWIFFRPMPSAATGAVGAAGVGLGTGVGVGVVDGVDGAGVGVGVGAGAQPCNRASNTAQPANGLKVRVVMVVASLAMAICMKCSAVLLDFLILIPSHAGSIASGSAGSAGVSLSKIAAGYARHPRKGR